VIRLFLCDRFSLIGGLFSAVTTLHHMDSNAYQPLFSANRSILQYDHEGYFDPTSLGLGDPARRQGHRELDLEN
jgi:hypothetical protein